MEKISFEDFSTQGNEISVLRRLIEQRKMVHALLITGEAGTGKRTLAMLLARALVCSADKNVPCGECSACRMSAAGEHPDITVIEKGIPLSAETAKGRATIPVDDIREMIRLCSRFAFEGVSRVVVIPNAEDMTVQAQNSLLKILEEPPQNTYFLMTSAHPDQLLTTVRSRCRFLKLIPKETEDIIRILTNSGVDPSRAESAARLSSGSVGQAIQLSSDEDYWRLRDEVNDTFFGSRKRSDILTISSRWKDRKEDAGSLYDILEQDIHLLLSFRLQPEGTISLDVFSEEWKRFASSATIDRFTFLTDSITEARRKTSFNVNFQATFEQLLLIFIGERDLWQR